MRRMRSALHIKPYCALRPGGVLGVALSTRVWQLTCVARHCKHGLACSSLVLLQSVLEQRQSFDVLLEQVTCSLPSDRRQWRPDVGS